MKGKKEINRRTFLRYSFLAASIGSAHLPLPRLLNKVYGAAAPKSVTLAYNADVASWDAQSVPEPNVQSIYSCVFDHYLMQDEALRLIPHVVKRWEYSGLAKNVLTLEIEKGIRFHNGDRLTAEDIKFSLDYARDPKGFNPTQAVWGNIENMEVVDDHLLRVHLRYFSASLIKWLAFLTAWVYPKAYFEKVGRSGFLENPVGSGPYRMRKHVRGSYLELEAFDDYWQGAPAVKRVTLKVVGDPFSRVAEIESGRSDFTLEIPPEEWHRLVKKRGLTGISQPISEVALIFLDESGPFGDRNIGLAAHHAIDKKAITEKLLRGFGVPLSTLEAAQYDAYEATFQFPYDPQKASELLAKSGYSTKNPVKVRFVTTQGFRIKDMEIVQVVAGMWRKVGIEARIEVMEKLKINESKAGGTLRDAHLDIWNNATGDPENSTGFAMFGPAPWNVYDSKEVDSMIGPLFAELDEKKRLEEYKRIARYVVEQGMIIPLFQVKQTIVMKKAVRYRPYVNNWVLPYKMDVVT